MPIELRPLAVALLDEHAMHRTFPVLADFGSPFELGRWESPFLMSVAPAPEAPSWGVFWSVWGRIGFFFGVSRSSMGSLTGEPDPQNVEKFYKPARRFRV